MSALTSLKLPASIANRLAAMPRLGVVLLAVLVFRLALNLPALIGANALPSSGGVPPGLPYDFKSIPGVWARWDSGHYLTIVRQGYVRDMERAFMPVFPLLMLALGFGNSALAIWSGAFISIAAFIAALAILWRQVRDDYGERGEAIATTSLIALNLFPTSFYFSALYTESLFLLLFALTYWFSRRQKFLWAACCVGLAALTRINGIVLGIIPVIELLQRTNLKTEWRNPRLWLTLIGIGAISIVGVIALVIYFKVTLNLPFAFIEQQRILMKRTPDWPWMSLLDQIRMVLFGYGGFEANKFMRVIGVLDLSALLLFIGLTALSFRRVRFSLAVYCVASLVVILSSHGPGTMGVYAASRYMLQLFPCFVVMALVLLQRTWLRRLTWAAFGALLIFLTVWFASGRWVA
jgi:Mannosyltransferase (PIG-V)